MRILVGEAAKVHPRVRGGAPPLTRRRGKGRGPSPRSRGSRRQSHREPPTGGSIPAFAGEPSKARPLTPMGSVHPRVRGGAGGLGCHRLAPRGPSPRSRGSPPSQAHCMASTGSIPAFAGEPCVGGRGREEEEVHPRVRGGALLGWIFMGAPGGPSPRSRGSLEKSDAGGLRIRSIPAFAGEPMLSTPAASCRTVHPRVRGGATRTRSPSTGAGGPSPRSRGSRARLLSRCGTLRSIPAFAGEPRQRARCRRRPAVHPRVRGGARHVIGDADNAQGPSPRSRGSLAAAHHDARVHGSIPAFAGEP